MKERHLAPMFRSLRRLVCIAFISLFIFGAPPAFGKSLWQKITTPGNHLVKWIGTRSGITPTVGNINKTAKSTTTLEEKTGKTIDEFKPKIDKALDKTDEILAWVKWPIIIATFAFAVWAVSVAIRGCVGMLRSNQPKPKPVLNINPEKSAPEQGRPKEKKARLSPRRPKRFARFAITFVGSVVYFALIFAIEFWLGGSILQSSSEGFPREIEIASWVIVAFGVSLVTGLLFCWFPLRPKYSFALGFVTPVLLFVAAFVTGY